MMPFTFNHPLSLFILESFELVYIFESVNSKRKIIFFQYFVFENLSDHFVFQWCMQKQWIISPDSALCNVFHDEVR